MWVLTKVCFFLALFASSFSITCYQFPACYLPVTKDFNFRLHVLQAEQVRGTPAPLANKIFRPLKLDDSTIQSTFKSVLQKYPVCETTQMVLSATVHKWPGFNYFPPAQRLPHSGQCVLYTTRACLQGMANPYLLRSFFNSSVQNQVSPINLCFVQALFSSEMGTKFKTINKFKICEPKSWSCSVYSNYSLSGKFNQPYSKLFDTRCDLLVN